jgi:hypothetical protein
MNIERANGFDPLNVPDGPNHAGKAGQGRIPAGDGSETLDRAADPRLEPYIQGAVASPEIRWDAVREAKLLLRSGILDTPEAARLAAENILTLGI